MQLVKTKSHTVSWINRADEAPNDLWQRCFPPPLEGKWWYSTLEKSDLERQFKFSYALVLSGSEAIAVAPCFLMDVPIEIVAPPFLAKVLRAAGLVFPSLGYQRTFFVGSPCADQGTIGIEPGRKLHEIASVLEDAVEARARQLRAPMIVWKDLPDKDVLELKQLTETHGMFAMTSYPGTSLSLPSGGFSQYLEQLTSQQRHNLRKKLRRSKERYSLTTEILEKPDHLVLSELFALFWQTYEKGKTKFERLTPEFFRSIAQLDVSRFILLRDQQTGQIVAFMLLFVLGAHVINKFIGIDYGYGTNAFLYFRLWEEVTTWVMSQGAQEFQSGQTGYRAKLDVGHKLVPLTNLCKHSNPLINRIYSGISDSIDWPSLDSDLAIYLQAHPELGLKQRLSFTSLIRV